MKLMTILGTRPEIIRLSLVIKGLDHNHDHILVYTGQNSDPALSDIFFKDLGVRAPDYMLGISGTSAGDQIAKIISATEMVMLEEKPDKLLILGDTNSGLSAIMAKRLAIPVYHMEAGNRCYDDRVPEEVNRRIIDHSSDVLMPYTERSRKNLLREGIPGEKIYVTGNPIFEVLQHYDGHIQRSSILNELGLEKGKYFLVTMHRAENVDIETRLRKLTLALERIHHEYSMPVVVSTHPRTRDRMRAFNLAAENEIIRFMPPFGFFDFISLEKNAGCVLSDSGTVQEECCIFRVPNVTIRDVTERPETIECGSNILSGAEPDVILSCVKAALSQKPDWTPPSEYLATGVSRTVIRILSSTLN